MFGLFRSSVVQVIEIREGKKGRFRWIGIDVHGDIRAVPANPGGWLQPEDAERDGREIFPRAIVRTRKSVKR